MNHTFRTPAIMALLCSFLCVGCGPSAEQIANEKTAVRLRSKNNLKMLGLGLHNYHDIHKVFPPGSTQSAEGKVGQNWAYSLLPFVDAMDVYNQIDSNLPWDHVSNRPAYQEEIEAYLSPSIPERKHASGLALAHYSGNSRIFSVNGRFRFRDTKDGTSNTIFLGEIVDNLPAWGDPSNVRDPAAGVNQPGGYGNPNGDGAYFLFADGSVKFIGNDVATDILTAFSTPDGGESMSSYSFPPDPGAFQKQNEDP